jgi:hypothetical protein
MKMTNVLCTNTTRVASRVCLVVLFGMFIVPAADAAPRWHNLMVRDQWERDHQQRGGDGTQVPRVLVYSPKNGYETVFMGVDTAGIYRSDDGGRIWVSKMEGIGAYFVRGIL